MDRRPVRDVLIVYLGWGLSYTGLGIVVQTFSPLFASGLRYAIAGTVAGAWWTAAGRPPPEAARDRRTVVAGVVVLAGGTGLLGLGVGTVGSGLSALVFATSPFWTALSARLFRHAAPVRALPLVLAAAGLLLLVGPDLRGEPAATTAVLLGTLCWSVGANVAYGIPGLGTPRNLAVQALAAAGVLLVAAVLAGEPVMRPGEHGDLSRGLVALLLLSTVASVVTYAAFQRLISRGLLQLAMSHTYVNPLVALAGGVLLLHERPSWLNLAGGVLVLAAAAAQLRESLVRHRMD